MFLQIMGVSPNDAFVFLRELLVAASLSPMLLLIGYGLMLIIGWCWGGMRKFLSILFFPGALLHVLSHYLAAELIGVNPPKLTGFSFKPPNESSYAVLRVGKLKHAIIIAIFPLFIAIPLLALLLIITLHTTGIFQLFFAYLILCIAFFSLPTVHDYMIITLAGMGRHPLSYFLLFLGVIITPLSFLAYPTFWLPITIGYYITIFTILFTPFEGEGEEERKELITETTV